jgi:MFS family permease
MTAGQGILCGASDGQQKETLLNRGFVGLNIVFFVACAAVSSFFYLQQHLQSLGISPVWTGLIIGADSVAGLFLQPFLAPFLHEGNARPWMVGGIVVMASALLCYSRAHTLAALLAVRIIQGAGFVCLIAAIMAALASCIPPSRSGQAFGFISLVRLVPYAAVPPLVTFLMTIYVPFPAVLAGFAFVMLLSIPLVLSTRPLSLASGHGSSDRIGFKGLAENLRARSICLLLAANLLFFITYTIVFFYIVGFGRQAGIGQASLFFTIATAVMIGVRLFGSPFFDKVNKPLVSAVCLVGLAAAFIALVHARGPVFHGLAVVFGLAWGVVMPLLNAIVFDISAPRFRGLNLNLTLVAMQGSFFLGPLLGGIVMGAWGFPTLFYLCCPLTLLTALLLVKIHRQGGARA